MHTHQTIIRSRTAARFAPLVLILAAFLAPAPAAFAQDAQSPAQLRRENDALREHIRELEAELQRTHEEIQQLSEEIETLRTQRQERRTTLPTSPIDATPGGVPEDRFACPAALKNWLDADYAHAFTNIPDPKLQTLNHWVRRTRLERSTVLWDLRILGWEPEDPSTARVIAFDWQTGENRCDPFRLTLTERDAEIIRASPELREWTIEGVFGANPVILRDGDPEPTAEDVIGQSIRFGWTMTIRSLEPFQADDPDRSIAR